MILPDVNVLVYAFHEGAPDHGRYREWLEAAVTTDEPIGFSDLVLSGFVRIEVVAAERPDSSADDAALACAVHPSQDRDARRVCVPR